MKLGKKNRKKYDEAYKASDKGKKNIEKWNCWEKNQQYYKEDNCLCCGELKKIVAKGMCDNCRKKEKRKLKKLSENT